MSVETSILIPTYNNGKYLLECIGSILRQEYTNYEIIIIDDHSLDNTFDLLTHLSKIDSRIKYYKNKKNSKGIASALNYGITLCKGDYIARMDADDLMIGNRLTEQISYLKNNQEIGAVCSGMQLINQDDLFIRKSIGNSNMMINKLMLLFINVFFHPTMTIRKEIYLSYKYKKSYVYSEDYELWTRIIQKHNITSLPFIHISYKVDGSRKTSKEYYDNYSQSIITILSNQLDFYKISHTERELLMHYSIYFRNEKIGSKEEMNIWINKIFSAKKIVKIFDTKTINEVRDQILYKIKEKYL
jgi:glycosyltransferase involved in cell wall biosynthesis